MSDKFVYRTALATPGLLKILINAGKGLKYYGQILPNPIIMAPKSCQNHANMGEWYICNRFFWPHD